MMYILKEEEYNSLISKEEHERAVSTLLETIVNDDYIISKLKYEVIKGRPCYKKGRNAYCDGCQLGFENLKICMGGTNYSK